MREAADLLIVGGGISGLVLARTVRRERPDWTVRLVEAAPRPGGTIRTATVDGCLFEHGPNGFLTGVTDTWDLAHDCGLGEHLRMADPRSERRFIYLDGSLVQLHRNPAKFLASPLLGAGAKLRLLGEPFRAPRRDGADESVAGFIRRRLGDEPARVLADAMVTGVFAGDAERLSLPAAFPVMERLEQDHGSLFRGMGAMMKERRRRREAGGPGGGLASFDGGMQVLVDALARDLGDVVSTGVRVESVVRDGGGFRVEGPDGAWPAARVALCVPAHAAAPLLEPHAPAAAEGVRGIEYAGVTVVGLVYDRSAVRGDVDSFGFLVPRGQDRRLLGCLFSGAVFPDHVPEDRVLCRVMLGGVRDPRAVDLDDDTAAGLAHTELGPLIGAQGLPRARAVVRWSRGIPQYTVGHRARVDDIEAALAAVPGLWVGGNAYRGVGVNDCVREATRLADRIVSQPVKEPA